MSVVVRKICRYVNSYIKRKYANVFISLVPKVIKQKL